MRPERLEAILSGWPTFTGQWIRSGLFYIGDVSNCPRRASSKFFSFRLVLSYITTDGVLWFHAGYGSFQASTSRALTEHLIYAQIRCKMTPVRSQYQFARSHKTGQRLAGKAREPGGKDVRLVATP